MTLVAGVDSSTQSTKVEVRELESGAIVAAGSAPHPPTTPPRSEADPAAWWSAFERAWSEAGSPVVEAISVGGQQHGMVVLDDRNEVVRPAKLWNDTESAPDAEWLIGKATNGSGSGREELARLTGSVPVAAFTSTKLSWLHRSEPDAWAQLRRVLLPHDWLTFCLTGAFTTDRGDASGTGYWSPGNDDWCMPVLEWIDGDLDWRAVLPRVAAPREQVGVWSDAAVAPGTGDNMAAALGVGLEAGDVVVSVGTSGTIYAVSESRTADPTGAVAGFADASGRFLPLVCTLNATKVTDAVARLLGGDHDGFDQLALSAEPGAGGLTMLPYLDGERTPNRPEAKGLVSGIGSEVSRGQLARAAVEGVVCGLLDGLDALTDAGVATGGRMLLVGGGAQSAAYRDVLATLAEREVTVPNVRQAVATGAAIQAATLLEPSTHREIAERWGLTNAARVESTQQADHEVRARYQDRKEKELP